MCEHPFHIHGYIVPCGKCNGCKADRQKHYSMLCSREETVSKYCYFITLTYAPEYLPTVHAVLSDGGSCYKFIADNKRDKNYGRQLFRFKFRNAKDKLAVDRLMWCRTHLWRAALGYLNYDDVKCFMKRLRRRYEYRYKEKIRFFVVGEYGPETLRPHWHLLLWFNSPRIQTDIVKGVLSCWNFGIVDCSQSLSRVASYVAGYVSSFASLPRVYQNNVMSPKVRHSNRLGCEDIIKDKTRVYDEGFAYFDGYITSLLGKSVALHPWRSLLNQLYPRCAAYDKKSRESRLFSYRLVRTAAEVYGSGHPVSYYVRCIFEDMINDVDNVLTCYFFENHPRIRGVFMNICYTLESDALYYPRMFGVITRELFISRAFYIRLCMSDWRNSERSLDMIDEFYKDKEYKALTEMYESQTIDACMHSLEDTIQSYYPDYDDNEELSLRINFEARPFVRSMKYKNMCMKNWSDVNRSVKRKLHNDKKRMLLYSYET